MRQQHTVRSIAMTAMVTLSLVFGVTGASAAPETGGATYSTATRATTAQRHSVQRLYLAYFGRQPERGGHNYWAAEYGSGRRSLQSISQFFALSDEFRTRYGSLSNTQFVRLVYRNVLGRSADPSGEAFWVAKLNRGASRGSVMVGFSESLEFQRKTNTVSPAPPAPAWQNQMVSLVNAERTNAGLRALTWCPPIARAATAHSTDQANKGHMSHVGTDGSNGGIRIRRAGYQWSMWAENVAYGYGDPASVMAAWMASGTHRTNLLDPDLVHIGVGRVAASNGIFYWTQNFGAGGTC